MQELISELNIVEYINVYLIMFLLALGFVFKHVYDWVPNKFIPILLYGAAILYLVLLNNDTWCTHTICNIIADATISASIAIGLHSGVGKPIVKAIIKHYTGSSNADTEDTDEYVEEEDTSESDDDSE